MRLKGDVQIPNGLEAARKNGQLVIFAGAGVSMDAPSCLPSFLELVWEVQDAARVERCPRDTKDLDRVLGGVDAIEGFDVARTIRRILTPPGSAPNKWHRAIVSLAEKPSEVRVVTTNYDGHIEAAASAQFGADLPVWSAPALPRGDEFRGVVHIHGTAYDPESSIVVTDIDFSRAYLTQGWARRFLVALFSSYTVLFVGYSHEDVVMDYLARGLPADTGQERYILVRRDDAEKEKWKRLGVIPVSYGESGSTDYDLARVALEDWVQRSRMTYLSHRDRIRRLASTVPPVDPLDDDYLRSCLRDRALTVLFCEAATDAYWLEWLGDEPEFQHLFDREAQTTEIGQVLARWYAGNFALAHVEDALRPFVRNGGRLSTVLWNAVAWHLYGAKGTDPDIRNRWIELLLSDPPADIEGDLLEVLARGSDRDEDVEAMLLLVEALAEPRVRYGPGFGSAVAIQIETYGSASGLNQIVGELVTPRLDDLADTVFRIALTAIEKAFRIASLHGEAHRHSDPISSTRASIAPHEQDRIRSGIDVVIDMGRDAAGHLAARRDVLAVVDRLLASRTPILDRIAIWLVAMHEGQSPEERIQWLLASNFLNETAYRHEVYQVLQLSFRDVSNELKSQLWQASTPDPDSYDSFNLASWLLQIEPEFRQAEELRDVAQARHDWGEPRQPDLLYSFANGWLDADEEPGEPPDPALIVERYKSPVDAKWQGIRVRTIGYWVSNDTAWGMSVLDAAANTGAMDAVLWADILEALGRADLSAEQLERILAIGGSVEEKAPLLEGLAQYLDAVAEHATFEKRAPLITASELLLEALQSAIATGAVRLADSGLDDPLTYAINRFPGRASNYFLRCLKFFNEEVDPCERIGLSHFLEIINDHGDETWAQLAISAVSRGFSYLSRVCPDVAALVAEWFAWGDPLVAKSAWSGLAYGGFSQDTMTSLQDDWHELARNISEFTGAVQDQLLERLGLVALRSDSEPEWLNALITENDPDVWADFADRIARFLGEVAEDGQRVGVHDWIGDYWSRRTSGIPREIAPREGDAMIHWALHLSDASEQIVELVRRTPMSDGYNYGFFRRLRESALWEESPAVALEVGVCILKSPMKVVDVSSIAGLLEDATELGVPDDLIRQVCEELTRRGIAAAVSPCR